MTDGSAMDDLRAEDDAALLTRVQPLLERLEGVRRKKLSVYEFRKKLGGAAAVVLTPICSYIDWFLLTLQSGSDDSFAGITILVLGALWWWVTVPKRQYARAYKTDILPHIARALGNLTYEADGKIPMSILKPSRIIPDHDQYHSEDCFEGEYKGVRIRLSEITLKERRRSGKRTHYVTVFKGLVVLIGIRTRRFSGHTVLSKNEVKIAEWLKEKATGLDRANLVDPEFEKMFDVYTDDQVEARYLIDPLMIERLKSLREIYEASGVSAAWYDNQMLILLPSKTNHFEPAGLYVPATDPDALKAMKHELANILSIIDYLDLVLGPAGAQRRVDAA